MEEINIGSNITAKYNKLLHHLNVEFPQLVQLSEETIKTFDITSKKRKRFLKILCQNAEELRKHYQAKVTFTSTLSSFEAHKRLLASAKLCPSTQISRFVEKDIHKLVQARGLEDLHPEILENMIAEIKDDFLQVTHYAGLCTKIKCLDETSRSISVAPYKYLGKTKRYMIYLWMRKELQMKWMLHQPLILSITKEFETLPTELFNLCVLQRNRIDIEVLDYELEQHLLEASQKVEEFYKNVTILIDKDQSDYPPEALASYLACCTCLVSLHISHAIENTLRHVINVFKHKQIPSLNLYITFTDKLVLHPTSEELIKLYHSLMKETLCIIEQLHVLQKCKLSGYQNKHLFLCLTDEFITACLEEVSHYITNLYEPVMEHLDMLNKDFSQLYGDIRSDVSMSDARFDEGCQKITMYRKYLSKVALIPESEYFLLGNLFLATYIQELKKGLTKLIDDIFRALSSQHLWEINDINESFEMIQMRAITKPSTTEEMIEIGKYIGWAKSEFVDELTERTEASLFSLVKIIDLGMLSNEHIHLNATAIYWIDEIIPIIEENITTFEQLKFESEEKLQRIIEEVNVLTMQVHPILCLLDNMDDISKGKTYLCQINNHMLKIKYIKDQINWINNEEVCLSFPKSAYPDYEELKNYVCPFYHLIKVSLDVQRNVSVWLDGQFDLLSYEETKQKVDQYCKELTLTQKNYRSKLRQAQDDNIPMRFRGTVDDPDVLNWPAPLKICAKTLKLVEDFKPCLSVMEVMCNTALKMRHWKEMSEIIGTDLIPNAGSTLRKLMKIDLQAHIEKLAIISQGATNEQELLETMINMNSDLEKINLQAKKYNETDVLEFVNLNDIMTFINEYLDRILVMNGSAFVSPYRNEMDGLNFKLSQIQKIMGCYRGLQTKFFHLFPLFTSKYICDQIPKEHKRFQKVKIFKISLDNLFIHSNVIDMVNIEELLENLIEFDLSFEIIYKGTYEYLNVTRVNFPRFFFLSEMELIEVLSEVDELNKLDKHFSKCFRYICKLLIRDSMIEGVTSEEEETFELSSPVSCHIPNKDLDIFPAMELEMRNTVLRKIHHAVTTYRNKGDELVRNYPGQIVLVSLQIDWTAYVHNYFATDEKCLNTEELANPLKKYFRLIREEKLSNSERITVKAIMVQMIHNRDVFQQLSVKSSLNSRDFKWLVQMKYYLEENNCMVRMLNISIEYGCEFLRNTERLTITPLTERCHTALLSAFALNSNGAVHGSAATGKTETIKELAQALAVCYVILCCSQTLTYSVIQRFLEGASKMCLWICLDEVNKLKPELLSVISDQLIHIRRGDLIKISPRSFICITSSPNYPHFTELPICFKALFRSFGLFTPDFRIITETCLFSYGYECASELSVKIIYIIKVINDLSPLRWYDLSIRTLKMILKRCDYNKQTNPVGNEDSLVVEAMIHIIEPMLMNEDTKILEGILNDVFPCTIRIKSSDDTLKVAIISTCKQLNLQPTDEVVKIIYDTYETISHTQNIILLGNTYTGKTKALEVLTKSLKCLEQFDSAEFFVVHPNIFSSNQLFGTFCSSLNIWTDGIISKYFREARYHKNVLNWLVFDGPIVPNWIEDLQSALGETKELHLSSGESIALPRYVSTIFEVAELEHISPTTVSRCGIVYFESSEMFWQSIAQSWINSCQRDWMKDNTNLITILFDWLIPACSNYISRNCYQLCKVHNISLLKNSIQIMETLLNEALSKKDEDLKNITTWIQASFLQGIINGLGSTLHADSKNKFDLYLKQVCKNNDPEHPFPKNLERLEVSIPVEGILSDYIYLYKGKGNWKYIPDTLKNEKLFPHKEILNTFVPTVETMKMMSLLNMTISNNYPTIFVGPSGSGKTVCIRHYLNDIVNKKQYKANFISFSPRITPRITQALILGKVERDFLQDKDNISARKNVIYIDDLNVISKDVYGVSPVVDLLRQYFNHKFWYDPTNYDRINVGDFTTVASMGPVGGSNQRLCSRFLSHFSVFITTPINEGTILRIFSNILQIAWRQNGFIADVLLIAQLVVIATVDVYKFCIKSFKPTPLKIHNTFNIRDFLKVVQGSSMIRKESADANKKIFSKLWVYESLRVFGDRLESDCEQNQLLDEMKTIFELHFKENFSEIFESIHGDIKQLIFGTLLDPEFKRYEEISVYQNYCDFVEATLKEYNKENGKNLDIVLFDYCLTQISKICRLLIIPCFSGFFLGACGSGKKTLTKLASHVYKQKLFEINICFNYNIEKWHSRLKEVLFESGGRGHDTVLLVTEEHLNYDFILEDINLLLKYGNIFDLFEDHEIPQILNMVRLDAQGGNPNVDISPDSVLSFFIKRCKLKLHIILSFNCDYNTLRNWVRLYPSLINYCTVVWFHSWPKSALTNIAHEWLSMSVVPNGIKKDIENCFVSIHEQAQLLSRKVFEQFGTMHSITTTSFIDFVKLFVRILKYQQTELTNEKKKFVVGLSKLTHADNQIAKMQKCMSDYQNQLRTMTEKAIEMTEQIANETVEVAKASNLVRADEQIANVQAEAAEVLKLDCEADLAQAIPILEDAISALNTLKPSDITLVKSMKNPPDAIKLVMAAVCVIKDVKPDRIPDPSTGRKLIDYWGPSKRILGDMNFLQTLKDFDKDHIKNDIMVKIRKEYLPHKDFKPHVVAKASSAAEGLCKWIIAMDMYDKVAKEVAPKKEKLEKAEKEYGQTLAILEEKKQEVVRLEKRLAQLNATLQEANKKQQKLQRIADACGRKLDRARDLIRGFENEKVRWSSEAQILQKHYDSLPGDILLSSSMIAYLAAIPEPFRSQTTESWYELVKSSSIPSSHKFQLITVLGRAENMSRWRIDTLSKDKYFIENIIIQEFSLNWPLFIDPQGIAKRWIMKAEDRNLLIHLKSHQSDFIQILEHCISFGKPLIIEIHGNALTSALDSLLRKDFHQIGESKILRLNEKDITYNERFRLFMTTHLSNPKFATNVYNKIKIINSTISPKALEEKLLKQVVCLENPMLTKRKKVQYYQRLENDKLMKSFEDCILKTLSEAAGDILEDETALKILDRTKRALKKAAKKFEDTEDFEEKYELYLNIYQEFSRHSTILYYCIFDMSQINHMYQFSMKWFMNIFKLSIRNAPTSQIVQTRLDNLYNTFTYNISTSVRRAILNKDETIFSFLVCTKLLLAGEKIKSSEYMLLINPDKYVEQTQPKNEVAELEYNDGAEHGKQSKVLDDMNTKPEWIINDVWRKILTLKIFPTLSGIPNSICEHSEEWRIFSEIREPEASILPQEWNKILNSFEKLILIRILRPDRIIICIEKFIAAELGEEYIKPLRLDLSIPYAESYCLSPIIIISPNNTYPLMNAKSFAEEKNYSNKFRSICLGSNDISKAGRLIEEGQSDGLWICLVNCHLANTHILKLEQICDKMDYDNCNENFRLWLTTGCSQYFPHSLLERSVKVVDETSETIRGNLLRFYQRSPIKDSKFYSDCSRIDIFRKLLYRITCFHSVIQGRQKFESTGFRSPFHFNDCDYFSTITELKTILDDYDDIHDPIQYLIGQCNYEDQFCNKWDRRIVRTIFHEFLDLTDSNGIRSMPIKNDYQDYVNHIKIITEPEHAAQFDLTECAEYRKNVFQARGFLSYVNDIFKIQRTDYPSDGQVLAIVEDILKILLSHSNFESYVKNLDYTYSDVTNLALHEELISYSNLLMNILRILKKLKSDIEEGVPLSPESENIAVSLLQNKIPSIFLQYSFMTVSNLFEYIHDISARLDFFKTWVDIGQPKEYWISAFFHPNTFLTAISLKMVRACGVKSLTDDWEVVTEKQSEGGVNIHGLYILNAGWDPIANTVINSSPNNYYSPLPALCIRPVIKNSLKVLYVAPVYKIDDRCKSRNHFRNLSNYIFSLHVQSDLALSFLIKKSVILTCQPPCSLEI